MKSRNGKRRKQKRSIGRKQKRIMAFAAVAVVFVFCMVCVLLVLAGTHFGNQDLICEGIHIGTIDVGGMTEEEAGERVNGYMAAQLGREITIAVNEHSIVATAGAMGVSFPQKNYAAEALAVGKKGNLWHKFQEARQAESGKRNIALKPQIDEAVLTDFVETQCSVYDIKAKNSKLKMENGRLKATKSRTGLEVKVPETVGLLKAELTKDSSEPAQISAELGQTEPKYTKEEVSKCTDLLGSYSTTYSTYQVARSANVALAAGRINGTIVLPGKVFSVVKTIKDRTEENGYQSAPEYSSGKVVDGIGGGVCQVSTTLYNAIINAELEIVERSPHSMMVSYVPVSRDAAISGDYKDFKFKNNTEYPIYLMGSASGGVLNFKVYGCETRPENREISFDSEIISTIEPGPEVVTEDPSLPAGYRSVTQSAHVGYRAKLWKIVKVDGVETERIELNNSAYNPSPQYVTVGKQKPTPTPEPSDKDKDKDKDDDDDKDSKAGKDGREAKSTEKPKATRKPAATATKAPKSNSTEEADTVE